MSQSGNTSGGSHNRSVAWDTSMARWAGEGKNWVHAVMKNPWAPGHQERQQDGGGLDQWQGKAEVGMGGSWDNSKTTEGMVG